MMELTGNTLVTGGTGFLGSHLVRALVNDSNAVIVLKRSTSDTGRLKSVLDKVTFYDIDRISLGEVLEHHTIKRIIHCATNYGRKKETAGEILEANLILPLRLLELCPKYGVTQFFNTDTILDKRINHYSLAKSQFGDWLRTFSREMVCTNILLEHFYGPRDDRSKFVTHVITQLLQAPPSLDFTKGEQLRDFIYIDDVVSAFLHILRFSETQKAGYHKFQVGLGESISIRNFVELASDLCGNDKTELNFGTLPYRENETMESHVDISMLKEIGWRPQTGLASGLLQTIQYERETGLL